MEIYNPILLINLIESDVAEFGGDALDELVTQLENAVKPLLASVGPAEIETLLKVGEVVGRIPYSNAWETRVGILLSIAQSLQPVGRSFAAIPFAYSAYRLAESQGREVNAKSLQRQAGNALAILFNDIGAPHRGLEYAIAAALQAKKLKDDVALARCLANASTSLRAQGLHRETISVSLRVLALAARCEKVPPSVTAHAYGNLSMSAYVLRDYRLGVQSAQHAVTRATLPANQSDVVNRLAIEGAFIKNLLALDQHALARERLDLMRRMSEPFSLERAHINVELSRAVVEIGEGDAMVGVSRLLALLPKCSPFPYLYGDTLEALVRAYEQSGNAVATAMYSSQLVEHVLKGHSSAIEKQLALIDEKLSTMQPGKEESFGLVEAVSPDGDHEKLTVDSKSQPIPEIAVTPIQSMFEQLAVSAELREDSTGRHAYRVGALAGMLAERLGYGTLYANDLEAAARLHDIGKLGIRDSVLNKPSGLTSEERLHIQRHTVIGQRILNIGKRPEFELARSVALRHHERWDGKGYPGNLMGLAIPVEARITKFADVWDALMHKRIYKPAWSFADAHDYIRANKGIEFDPKFTDVFLKMVLDLYSALDDNAAAVDDQLARAAQHLPSMRARESLELLISEVPVLWSDPNADLDDSEFLMRL